MCIVCVQWNLKRLTAKEAHAALNEIVNTGSPDWDHVWKLRKELNEAERLEAEKEDQDEQTPLKEPFVK